MELFALLASCIFIGLSSGEDVQAYYGQRQPFRVPAHAEYLYFESKLDSDSKLYLWTRSKPSNTIRGVFDGRVFLIEELTQVDNGIYTIQTRYNHTVATYSIIVSHYESTLFYTVGEELHFDYSLDPKLCTLIFTPSDGDGMVIFSKGYVRKMYFGMRLKLRESIVPTISIDIEDLRVKDSGVFEILDDKDNLAMRLNLEVAASAPLWVNAGWAAGIVSVVVSCCCCLKRCCCRKSSKSSEEDTQPAENPLDHQQYSAEPIPPSYHREPIPNVGHQYAYHPADPGPSAVEMYSPASVPFTAPPAQAPAMPDVSLTSNFLSSETDPCFEMKGMNLPPPLYSECVSADVYTSDKLNFGFL
ncbi:unnamed protein product [Lota lota]